MSRTNTRPNTRSRSATTSGPRAISFLHMIAIIAAFGSMAANYGSQHMTTGAGGSCRSQHFVVQAPTAEFARQVCAEAERFRRELAIEWLGQELPPWQDPCPIRVIVGANLGAGGATSFTFINDQPRSWDMEIQGSRARILDSVLPHEITHTIMATHFGRPLPRWADEGAATSVEDTVERTKQDKLLIQFLTTNRGIAFNQMFAMKDYPRDILPLYSQGYSLARYMIARGGKRKFVAYVGDGMRWNNWTAATQKHYSMKSLSELQVTWLAWVGQGSPPISSDIALLSHTTPVATSGPSPGKQNLVATNSSALVPLPSRIPSRANNARPTTTVPTTNAILRTPAGASTQAALTTSPSDGWYSRRRDEAANQTRGATTSTATAGTQQHVGRPSVMR